ncbi:MAG: cobalt ECF transporter T component CbiQ [Paramuribaculum sp.]|nr:cobalt ECF transporter T component CbiQ [Paramuribaculum sp.]
MGSSLEKAINSFAALERGGEANGFVPDARCSFIVTILYLVAMLSVPVGALSRLVWFAVFPIVGSAVQGVGYGKIFMRSLVVLPIVALIGIANPFFNRVPAFYICGHEITEGWIEFVSILLRGILSVQALLLLCAGSGITGMCRAMNRLGLPDFVSSVLLMVCRYISVLLEEALCMRRARESRGYGKKSFPLSSWGTFIGQLLLRTVERGERVHRAMLSRGFEGKVVAFGASERWRVCDTIYLIAWLMVFIFLWFVNPSRFFV